MREHLARKTERDTVFCPAVTCQYSTAVLMSYLCSHLETNNVGVVPHLPMYLRLFSEVSLRRFAARDALDGHDLPGGLVRPHRNRPELSAA